MAKRKRKGLSKRQRFEVFKRDGFACQYCGRKPPEVILEADHMVPIAAGGEDHESNMVTACKDCNGGKSDRKLEQMPASLDGQMQDRHDRMAQIKEYNAFLLALREYEIQTVSDIGTYWCDKTNPPDDQGQFTFSEDRAASVRRFLQHLPPVELLDAIDIAFARMPPYQSKWTVDDTTTFKYFCGVCWRRIKKNDPPEGTS